MSLRIPHSTTHVRELDAPPTVLRRLAAERPDRYPMLLESVAPGPLGRVSLLLALPRAALWLDRQGRLGASEGVPCEGGFLESLEQWWLAERVSWASETVPDVPFAGGWALFLGYEMAQEIEPHLALPVARYPWRAFALRTPCALAHVAGEVELAASLEAHAALETPPPLELRIREEEPERHLERVRRAKEYIRAGDIYQANLSRPWEALPIG